MCQLVASGHIGCCIAYTERAAVALGRDVSLDIADSRLDESRGSRLVGRADVLVTSEEAKDVLVLLEVVDDAGVALVKGNIPLRVVRNDRCAGLAQVSNHVDVCRGQLRHAVIVVLRWVDGIHADDVGVDLLQVGNVPLAGITISQRVSVSGV